MRVKSKARTEKKSSTGTLLSQCLIPMTHYLETIVVKNIDVRIKNIKKHVLYPIIKNMKKTFVKNISPYST